MTLDQMINCIINSSDLYGHLNFFSSPRCFSIFIWIKAPNDLIISLCFKDTINPSQLFIFTNVIRCSRLPLWLDCFMYFKFTQFNSLSITTSLDQSKKQIVFFYLMFLNIYYRGKLAFSKLVGKINFSEKKLEQMH